MDETIYKVIHILREIQLKKLACEKVLEGYYLLYSTIPEKEKNNLIIDINKMNLSLNRLNKQYEQSATDIKLYLSKMEKMYLDIFNNIFFYGKSIPETSEILHIEKSQVEKMLSQIHKYLKNFNK